MSKVLRSFIFFLKVNVAYDHIGPLFVSDDTLSKAATLMDYNMSTLSRKERKAWR